MQIDWLEILVGLQGAFGELAGLVAALVLGSEPWVKFAVCLFLALWVVVVMVRLADFVKRRLLRLLRRYHGCAFTGCPARIRTKYRLCRNHFRAASRYELEHRDEWAAMDAKSDAFYVYILELEDGELYAGQTRNLMRRMDEHRKGSTKTTAGRNPKLVWFQQLPSRLAAVEQEADLKHRIDVQPEGVRGMVAAFRSR